MNACTRERGGQTLPGTGATGTWEGDPRDGLDQRGLASALRTHNRYHRYVDIRLNATLERLSRAITNFNKDTHPVLCIRLMSSSILRLSALCSRLDRPTPGSAPDMGSEEGVVGTGGVNAVASGSKLKDLCEVDETKESTEEGGIDLVIWCLLGLKFEVCDEKLKRRIWDPGIPGQVLYSCG